MNVQRFPFPEETYENPAPASGAFAFVAHPFGVAASAAMMAPCFRIYQVAYEQAIRATQPVSASQVARNITWN